MGIHVGEIIEKKFQESGIKLSVFAERINTGERNVYSIFKRKDINAGMLKDISEVLNFNFFDLYIPSTEGSQVKEASEQTISVNLTLAVPQKKLSALPNFLSQVSELGTKFGYTLK